MSSRVEFGQDTEQFFQRFTLIEQIGVGGFATVHRGLDRLSNEFVAVKTRHSIFLRTAVSNARFTFFRRFNTKI